VKKSRIRASPQDLLSIVPFSLFVLAELSAVYPRFSVFFDIGHAAWRPSQGNFYLAQKWSESYPQIVALAVVKADEPQAYRKPSCARFG
jgi:hypothetical protein